MMQFNNDWDNILYEEINKPYSNELRTFLANEYTTKEIHPDKNDIFNSLKYTTFKNTKVVILGQDPYINYGQAHGLAFSVQVTASIPPSLKNIFKELEADIGCYIPNNGCLIKWAKQGVLLLNNILTVENKKSKSHANIGWEEFTTNIIKKLNNKEQSVVFLLWGRDAQTKTKVIKNTNHKILIATHPSPLAGGKFFGCKHFSKTNEFLREMNLPTIDWQIDNV
jgi:uracil-DNA glycosylase